MRSSSGPTSTISALGSSARSSSDTLSAVPAEAFDHHDHPLALGGRVDLGPGEGGCGLGRLVGGDRPEPAGDEAGGDAERRPPGDIGGMVHAGAHPGVRHQPGQGGHRRGRPAAAPGPRPWRRRMRPRCGPTGTTTWSAAAPRAGGGVASGRGRRARSLTGPLARADATPAAISPRRAARRPNRPPLAARTAATSHHSRDRSARPETAAADRCRWRSSRRLIGPSGGGGSGPRRRSRARRRPARGRRPTKGSGRRGGRPGGGGRRRCPPPGGRRPGPRRRPAGHR